MHEPDPPEDGEQARIDALLRATLGGDARREPDGEPTDDAIDDRELQAWRDGALDDEAAAAFEDRLAADRDARDLALAAREPVPESLLTWAENQAPRATRRTVRPWGGLALAAVALIAVGAAFLWRGGQPPPAYVTSGLEGAAATTRSEQTPSGTPVFRTQGVLSVTLRPEVAGEAPPVRAFIARPDAPLQAAEVRVERPAGGALVIEAPVRDLFGAEYGPWRFYVALGDADGAAGRPYAEARQGDDTTWFEYPLVFQPVPDDGGAP